MNKKFFGGVVFCAVLVASLAGQAFSGAVLSAHGEEGSTLADRIAERKAKVQVQLDTAASDRLKAKCKAAQTVLKNMQQRNQNGHNNRKQRYEAISNKLTDIVSKLEKQNVNATELKNVMNQYKQKLAVFQDDFEHYNDALEDAIAMDCASDPAGFKVNLETLRSLRQKLIADAKDIKSLQPQLVKALANARIALANTRPATNGETN